MRNTPNRTDTNLMPEGKLGFSTRSIHHGYDPYAGVGSLNPPIYLSSTFTFPTVEDGAARFSGEQDGYIYGRLGNPTTALLEALAQYLGTAEKPITAEQVRKIVRDELAHAR